MSNDYGIQRIVEEIEYLRAKRMRDADAIPRLVITHGHHRAVQDCLPGETIEQACFAVGPRVVPLRLSPTGLVLVDVLGRKRPTPLSVTQIERIIASDPFYVRLGANAAPITTHPIKLTRKTIKVYIQRLRQQIGKALEEAGLALQPENVLVSDDTELLSVKAYRLAIACEFVHLGGAGEREVAIPTVPFEIEEKQRRPVRSLRWLPTEDNF